MEKEIAFTAYFNSYMVSFPSVLAAFRGLLIFSSVDCYRHLFFVFLFLQMSVSMITAKIFCTIVMGFGKFSFWEL